jgi:hypothetical protein
MAKVGDLVRVVHGDEPYFYPGTLARVKEIDADGDVRGDFRDLGNAEGTFDPDCDGTWCVGRGGEFVVVPS